MCPPRRLVTFFCQQFRLVWIGWLPHTHFAPAADNGHFKENNGDSWTKFACKKRRKSQSHLLSFCCHTWEQKGNWPYAACEQSVFRALLEIHPCLAKFSVVCMFFRGFLKFGCFISLKAWFVQCLLWPKAVFPQNMLSLAPSHWLSTSKVYQ